VPIETFGVAAQWDAGTGILDIWPHPDAQVPDQTARALRLPATRGVHYDVTSAQLRARKAGLKTPCSSVPGEKARRSGALIETGWKTCGGSMQGPTLLRHAVAFDADARYAR